MDWNGLDWTGLVWHNSEERGGRGGVEVAESTIKSLLLLEVILMPRLVTAVELRSAGGSRGLSSYPSGNDSSALCKVTNTKSVCVLL